MSLIQVSSAATVPGVPRGRSGGQTNAAPVSLTKPQALTRAGGSASARSARGKAGFASVLESVQHEDEQLDASRTRQAPAARVERDHDIAVDARRDRVSSAEDSDRTVDTPATPATPQTPWLLLALGSGLRAWQDSPSSEQPGDEAVDMNGGLEDGAADVLAAVTADPAGLSIVPDAGVTVVAAAVAAPRTAVDVTVAETGAPDASVPDDVGLAIPAQALPEQVESDAESLVPDAPVMERKASPIVPPTTAVEAADAAPTLKADVKPTAEPAIHTVPSGAAAEKPATAATGAANDPQAQAADQAPRPSARAASWLAQQAAAAKTGASDVDAAVAAPPQQQTSLGDAAAASLRESLPLEERLPAGQGAARRGAQDGVAPAPIVQTPQVMSAPPDTAPVAQTMALPEAVGEQVLDQIVTSVRLQWKDGIGEAKLQLRPDSLGTVNVSLKVEAGAVTAVVRAESADVQEWVVKHQDSLRQQMEAAGLNLAELVVSPDDRGQGKQEAPPQQRRQRQSVMAAQTRRFEELL